MTDRTLWLLVFLACAVIGVLWFLADHYLITPFRVRKARRVAQEQLAKMRHAAGVQPHLPRRVRRARARAFAKKLTILARVSGTTAGLPRHEVQRRRKGLAAAIARVG